MLIEIPDCKRCCCFIPLRYGIIVFGYINLAFSLLILGFESWLSIGDMSSLRTMLLYRGMSFYSQVWFAVVLYTMEVIFNIILLIGAHMKNVCLLRAYFYYGITTTLSAFLILIAVKHRDLFEDDISLIMEGSFVFCAFMLQAYLLLLIRSELKKLRQYNQLSFVNHVAEIVVESPVVPEGINPL